MEAEVEAGKLEGVGAEGGMVEVVAVGEGVRSHVLEILLSLGSALWPCCIH